MDSHRPSTAKVLVYASGANEEFYLPAKDAVFVINVNRLDLDDQSQPTKLFLLLTKALFPPLRELVNDATSALDPTTRFPDPWITHGSRRYRITQWATA